ncbi:MAG: response regulator, partial [Desulfovibrionaceae bacterium]
VDMTSEAITGVVRVEDRLVLVLDMEKILAELSQEDTPDVCAQHPTNVCVKQGQYRAIIADDSPSIRRLIQGILERAGFEVQAFQNGRDAWERLLAIKEQAAGEGRPVTDYVDLLVSDIEMPGMDGHSLTRSIKEDRALRELPVMLFSSLITDSLRHKGEAVGADAQIAKPDITLLADRALEILHQRGQKPLV